MTSPATTASPRPQLASIDPLVGSRHRVAGEQHAGHVGVDRAPAPRPPSAASASSPSGAVGLRAGVRGRRRARARHGGDGASARTPRGRVRWAPAKLAPAESSSKALDRTAHGLRPALICPTAPTRPGRRGHRLDEGRRTARTPRHRQPRTAGPCPAAPPCRRRRPARPDEPVTGPQSRRSAWVAARCCTDDRTSPVAPSTRTRPRPESCAVASRVPTMPGMPYSRATIAAWLSWPPRSVTIAPSSGSTTLKYGEVMRVTRTSPCCTRSKSAESSITRAVPS